MDSLQKGHAISMERSACGANISPPTCVFTSLSTVLVLTIIVEASPIAARSDQPSPVDIVVFAEDKPQSLSASMKRNQYQDQSPLLE